MKEIQNASLVHWPSDEVSENFEFDVIDTDGTFKFSFKWMNDRWNCWVTLPDNSVREAGVYPNVISWSGFLDYGIMFKTSLSEINYTSLLLTELYILKW